MDANKIEIVLNKGAIGLTENQRLNLRGLGLRHRHQRVVLEDTASVRGMIKKVIHLVAVGRPKKDVTVKAKAKDYVEIIASSVETPAKKKETAKPAAKKVVKKTASKKKE